MVTMRSFVFAAVFALFSLTVIAVSPAAYALEEAAATDAGATKAVGEKVEEVTADAKKEAPAMSEAEADEVLKGIVTFDESKVLGHAKPWQHGYQDAASPVMEQFTWLHDYVMIIITVITIFVTLLIIYICVRFRENRNPNPQQFAHNTTIEILWTVLPVIILVAIAIPSLRTHYQYSNNETIIANPDMTLKVTGNQWYWSYEYPDFGISFDSNMKQEKDLAPGEPRLLAVDNVIVVPVNKVVRVQVTSADVIHAFAVPAFGVKQDTVPGRLNETWFKATREGIFYGQCSELCGKFHGYMPIEVHVVSEDVFAQWVAAAKVKFASLNNAPMQFAAAN